MMERKRILALSRDDPYDHWQDHNYGCVFFFFSSALR